MPALPQSYRILPHDVPFFVPGFERQLNARVLAPEQLDCEAWYRAFIERILQARGKQFLPVCRMSDGEFLFALGHQPADSRRPHWERALWRVNQLATFIYRRGHFQAGVRGQYHSGDYTYREWMALREKFARDIKWAGERGVLALHLTYHKKRWQEFYFPAFGKWLDAHGIDLHADNYVPFYFAYGALTGSHSREVLAGRVLVLNGAVGEKRQRIEASLRAAGAHEVIWLTLSERRAMLDVIDVTPLVGQVDIALVGAGLGKANILRQLEPLQVPCIDAGFILEVWADPTCALERPYCLPT